MIEFTKQMKFIFSFLVITLLLSMFTNVKFTYSFLVIVLIGMLLTNSSVFEKLLGGFKYE